jgi:dihydrofolate reductase
MIISLIVAMDENRGIGRAGSLPWHLPADLKRFKELTTGHYLIMGRKTFDSIGRALPGRTSIIITRNRSFLPAISDLTQLKIAHSLGEALSIAEAAGESEAFIIGGGEIFQQAMPLADRIYLTQIHAQLPCDTFFPELDPSEWQIREEIYQAADDRNIYPTTFQALLRR